ncbi:MAG: NAD-dependent epimerase/dehydratase family protein [Nanoarchaeota archaeon]|nr:NAD-dependent epimerase/dehydratase family protein [Nanoarchaeota archaeon]
MKISVTGGKGFLGKNVVNLLKQKGYEVFSMDKTDSIDILDYDFFKVQLEKIKPDIVVHCAAHVGGIAYNRLHPVEVFEDNVKIGLNIVRACNEVGINNFINIMPNCTYPGNMEEYEESKWWDGPMHDSVLTYGLPRKMVWGACFAYCKKNKDFKPIHLIFPNMYGPNDHFEIIRSHALGALISKIIDAKEKNKKIVEIWGTGNPVREWLFVKDGAESILKAIENIDKFDPNEIMNIGVRKGISIKDMAEIIKEIVGWKGKFVYQTEKPDGAMKKILVTEKMKQKLNWEPSTELKEGIKLTVDWYYKNIIKK